MLYRQRYCWSQFESQWEVTYSTTTVIVDTPAYTFHNLPLSNGYTVHLRAICDDGDTSSVVTASYLNNRYWVTAIPGNPDFGSVTGGGMFYYGDIATLAVTANPGYIFAEWDDGNTANPRSLVVTRDTTLIALFLTSEDTTDIGIDNEFSIRNSQFSIFPNPAENSVTVSLPGITGKITISLLDLLGRELITEQIECSAECTKTLTLKTFPSGTYLLRITSEATPPLLKKLIIK